MGYKNKTKYNNKKIVVDGITFDSKKEAKRYSELKLLEKAGEIKNLELQKRFLLIPAIREPDTIGPRGGIKEGKVKERATYYVADFVYFDMRNNQYVVEDVKGYKTDVYKLKKKLFQFIYKIDILET